MHRFSSLDPISGLNYSITHRHGGISQGPYASNNLGFHVGDDPETVRANRQQTAHAHGYEPARLVAAQQVHGTGVAHVSPLQAGRGALDWDSALPETDALYTRERGLPLLILVADCAPLLLVDAENQVLGLVHAGWRGAAAGIAGIAARTMTPNPARLQVGIGPCLCEACLEVGEEVAQQVATRHSLAVKTGSTRPHLDLRGLLQQDLLGAGVLPHNIQILDICPRCARRDYFSHRGDGGTTGRFGIVAWWQE